MPAADLCCVGLGYLFALHLAFHPSFKGLFVLAWNRSWEAEYSTLFLLAILSWATTTSYSISYHSTRTESLALAGGALMRTLILWMLMTASGTFVFKLESVSRQFTIYFFITSSILVLSTHLATLVILRRRRRFGRNWRTAVIIGERENCQRFGQLLTAAYPRDFRIHISALNNSIKDTSSGASPVIRYADDGAPRRRGKEALMGT
jgi:CoA-binding domain